MKPTDYSLRIVSAHTPHKKDHIRVETVRAIVGELEGLCGNKVYPVVTPAR